MSNSIISFKWNNSNHFLRCNADRIEINTVGVVHKFPFSSLISIHIDTKKKLAPLIAGAVVTSLALVNILVEGAGLTMIGFLSIGLIILYLGASDYWVIKIEQFNEAKSVWISKNKCQIFSKTLINILDFRVSKGFFPPLYVKINKNNLNSIIAETTQLELIENPLNYYLTPPQRNQNELVVKINLASLSGELAIATDMAYVALSKYKINKEAIISVDL